ncbi:MAG: cyclophilin-like fold protein [Clostridia bacterium]|nr:cyclophilin-like fold protein [Clostridia bacterium]
MGNNFKTAELEINASTDELVEILRKGELKMPASNYGGFEKVCTIGQSISRDDKQITTRPGDIMLYNGSQIVIFYDSNSWAYTQIGHINESADELEKFLSGSESEVIIRVLQ